MRQGPLGRVAGVRHVRTVPLLPLAYLLLVVPLTLLMAVVAPPGQIPDEAAHMVRADGLLHGALVGHAGIVTTAERADFPAAGGMADRGLIEVMSLLATTPETRTTPDLLAKARAVDWQGPAFFFAGPIAAYLPVFYAPAAAAIGTAHALGASPYWAIMAARVTNAVCFSVIGLLALVLAARGQGLIFCTLAVPMSLNLGGSLNQDGLMIAACALAAALMSRAAAEARAPGAVRRAFPPKVVAAAALIAAVVLAKAPYAPLAVLLLLPLPWGRGALSDRVLWGRIALVGAIVAAGAAWVAFIAGPASMPLPRAPYEAGPLWPEPRPAAFSSTDMGAQVKVLLADPLRLLTLPTGSILHDRGLIRQVIGTLGWQNVLLPTALYTAWNIALLAAALGDLLRRPPPPRPWAPHVAESLLLLAAAVATLYAIYLSQYLAWTQVGEARIIGPQGRYFLPLLPLLALAVPAAGTRWSRVPALVFAAVPAAVALADLLLVPGLLRASYYAP